MVSSTLPATEALARRRLILLAATHTTLSARMASSRCGTVFTRRRIMRRVRRGRLPYLDQWVAASMPESGRPRQAAGGRTRSETEPARWTTLGRRCIRFWLLTARDREQ